jgi:HEAT repeat protein
MEQAKGRGADRTPLEDRLQDLADARPRLRRAALDHLAARPGAQATEGLIQLLADPSRPVRLEAIRRLAERRGRRARTALLSVLDAADGADPDLVATAVASLAALGGARVEERYAAILADPAAPAHAAVLDHLPCPPPARLVEPLIARARRPAAAGRAAALAALALLAAAARRRRRRT